MLQKLNERIQGVVAWLVVILIAITFTLFGLDYFMQSKQTSDVKVLVNSQPITEQSFENNYRRARAQQDVRMTAVDEKSLKKQVLDQLISNSVTVQSAHHNGFEVSTEQANNAILHIPQFQEDGHFSSQRYQQALNNALFTPETFQNEVKQGMLLNQQRFAFMGSSFALPEEITRFVKLYLQTRDYQYLSIPVLDFEKTIQIPQEQIEAYYKKHTKQFMAPEQISLDYVILTMSDIRSKVSVSAEDIKRYYEENQNNYLTPAQWKVSHILFAVPETASQEDIETMQHKAEGVYAQLQKNPEQFKQLVKSNSDDKLSAMEEGILPVVVAGQNDYSKLLTSLTVPGQISEPVRTKTGFEIFKLISYKPVSNKTQAEVEAMIKEQLIADMVQAQYAQALEQLTDLSYQSPDSLQPVADTLKLKIQHSGTFSSKGGSDLISKNKQVLDAAFSPDILALGNNSDPIQLDNDKVVVFRIKTHIPVKQQPLAEVQTQIQKLLTLNLAREKAKNLGTSLLNAQGEALEQLISTNHLQWKKVTKSSRDNDQLDAAINEAAFNLLRVGDKDMISLNKGDYALVKLDSINDGDIDTVDQEQRRSLIQQIESSYGMLDYELYVNNLMSQAKIEYVK